MLINDPLIVRIVAKGQPLQMAIASQVTRFSYQDSEKEDDMLSVTFADPYNLLVDSDQFLENTEWIVQWGFPTKLHPPRKVLVKRPVFRHGEIEIQALDKGSRLKLDENWSVHKKTSPKKLIEHIAQKNQLIAIVDDDLGKEIISSFSMGGRTDYDVLKYLQSQAEDHFFKIQDDKVVFQKRDMSSPPKATYEYEPGRSSRLLSFEISIKDQDNAKSSRQTTAVSVDPFTHKTKIFKSDEGTTSVQNLGSRRTTDKYPSTFDVDFPGKVLNGGKKKQPTQGQTTGKSLILPPKSDSQLQAIAKGKRRKSLLDSCKAKFEIVASPDDPFLKSGDLIQVLGIGKRFSGIYRILAITHDLSDGYKYSIDAQRNAVGSTGKKSSKPLNGPKNTKSAISQIKETVGKVIVGAKSGIKYGQGGLSL